MGVQQQLSLEDPHSSLNWSPPSKQKEEHLPTMRRKQLPWNQHYPGHPTTATILSLYSFAQSPCVKLSFIHPIHNIPSTPCSLSSLFNGSLANLPFQVAIQPTKQPKKPSPFIATDTMLPVSLSSSIQVINETTCDALPTHKHVALVYQQ